ncbi:hypothetical protein AMJ48_01670 [Parcubacteria bacterium DG_74_1]|nr:MAG: hypothetical protein AMJ48_01670 [Parcubacteria bacterium DG_74_1]
MIRLASIITILIFLILPSLSLAEEAPDLYFFWAEGCPFCEQQKDFLKEIEEQYPRINIRQYSTEEPGSINILIRLVEEHPGSERYLGATPMTFIGEDFFVGFSSEIGNEIENSIEKYYQETEIENEEKDTFYLPILGNINPEKWPLGGLALVIGLIDGLNICSLGALIIILILVFALHSRKLTIFFGGFFIFITALVYGFLIFIWNQLFSVFLPYMSAMEMIIGLAAFLGGFYFLKQFFDFRKQGPVCRIEENKIISSLTKKLENSFKEKKSNWALLGGVIFFAAMVTIIEFPCSAVFPIVFTGILAQANLSIVASLFYIFIYLLFYMLDEIAVFLIAVFTRKIWINSGPFMTWISFIGALVLFFISYYYIFVL